MSPSSKALILTALGCSLTAFFMLRSSKSSKASADVPRGDHLNPDDCIQPEDVVIIFDTLYVHMQNVIANLSQQIQQIQMTGQSVPEKQLRQLLKAEFERALLAKQTLVFEEYDVDEDCLREATWEFLQEEDKYPKVKKSIERFQTLYETITKEKVIGRRPGDGKGGDAKAEEESLHLVGADEVKADSPAMTKELTLEAAAAYFDALTSTMGYIVQRFKEENRDFRDPMVVQQLQLQFAAVANDAGEEALMKVGVSLTSFREGIEKHQNDPSVGRALAMLQMKQQQDFIDMGLPDM
jgi:hypothetical protein